MRHIFILGTIHDGHTPPTELITALEQLQPDQVMLEIPRGTDADAVRHTDDWRDEMRAAYRWAREQDIPTIFFDENMPLFRDGYSVEHPAYAEFIKKAEAEIAKHSWKELNKPEYDSLFGEEYFTIFDKEKDSAREHTLLANITEQLPEQGNVVIVTGTGHLAFFEKNLPDATFPLRYSSAQQV